MGRDRNGRPCPHNVTEEDEFGETYCVECGDVVEEGPLGEDYFSEE